MAEPIKSVRIAGASQSPGHGDHGGQHATASSFPAALDGALQARTRQITVPGKLNELDPHIHERALALNAYRLQILASNIANGDTPGYQARDIDVARALREHTRLGAVPLEYVVSSQPSIDGNTVELDVQRTKFAEASVMYQFEIDRVSGHYKHMMELFQSLKG